MVYGMTIVRRLPVEGRLGLGVRIPALRDRHRDRRDLRRLEPGIDGAEVDEAREQQAGADEEHHRDRDLAHDERAPHAARGPDRDDLQDPRGVCGFRSRWLLARTARCCA